MVVRPGLFIAGVSIAVIGAGLMVSLFFLPAPPTDMRTNSVIITDLGPNATKAPEIAEVSAYSGTRALGWNSSGPVSVALWKAVPCASASVACFPSKPVVNWTGMIKGSWTFQGTIGSTYFLSISNFGRTPISFSGTLTETYVVPTVSQEVPAWALILLGGLVLLAIGGVAAFLGLFLEHGVYRPPRPGSSRAEREPVDPIGDLSSEPR